MHGSALERGSRCGARTFSSDADTLPNPRKPPAAAATIFANPTIWFLSRRFCSSLSCAVSDLMYASHALEQLVARRASRARSGAARSRRCPARGPCRGRPGGSRCARCPGSSPSAHATGSAGTSDSAAIVFGLRPSCDEPVEHRVIGHARRLAQVLAGRWASSLSFIDGELLPCSPFRRTVLQRSAAFFETHFGHEANLPQVICACSSSSRSRMGRSTGTRHPTGGIVGT